MFSTHDGHKDLTTLNVQTEISYSLHWTRIFLHDTHTDMQIKCVWCWIQSVAVQVPRFSTQMGHIQNIADIINGPEMVYFR